MWSDKKYVNILINVLLFCVAINIFHYGQLLLPVICLILFVDNKLQFKVNNPIIFIVLCLFAVSFYAFSYQLGFYSVMGFCLPMAYYIGSNLRNPNEENVKKIIYIIAFGMATHLILNFLLELCFWHDNLSYLFEKVSHYDIWLFTTDPGAVEQYEGNNFLPNVQFIRVRTTATSMNYIMLCAVSYYLFKYENNRFFKYTGIILFIISSIYCLALGRRTTAFIFLVSVFLSLFMEIKNSKININKNVLKIGMTVFIILIVFLIAVFSFNIFGLRESLLKINIVFKLYYHGLRTNRLEILIESLKLAPNYLFGGQQLSSATGSVIHDLWGDIYDYAGIIPYILMIVYSVHVIKVFIRVFKNQTMTSELKTFFIVWFITSSLIMFIEPVMTGASIYLICYIIISSSIEEYLNSLYTVDQII